MNDLVQVLREIGITRQGDIKLRRLANKAGLKFAEVADLLDGRGEPTWPVIAKIVDALDDFNTPPGFEFWKAKWAASLDAGKWDTESH